MSAFKKGQPSCELDSGRQLHFETKKQISASGRRRDIRCIFEVPPHWNISAEEILNSMKPTPTQGLAQANRLETSEERFLQVTNRISDEQQLRTFTALLNESCFHHTGLDFGQGSCKSSFRVKEAFQIMNPELWHKFITSRGWLQDRHVRDGITAAQISPPLGTSLQGQARSMVKQCHERYNECLLFHGTSFNNAKTIAVSGFDARLARDNGYYGRGTYFACQSCKSAQYGESSSSFSKSCMILSRVVLGNPHYVRSVVTRWTKAPEGCDSAIAAPGPMEGHSRGDQTHMEFVIYDNAYAYPEYLLIYE